MAQVEAEEVIAPETADVSDAVTRAVTHVQATAASSEAAAEAPVVYGEVAAEAPGIVGTVKTDDTADPVSKVTVASGCFPPSSTDDTHQRVMRGGPLKEPYLVIGNETTTAPFPTELVLRGGYLRLPVRLTDLEIIGEERFFKVQKWIPGFVSSSRGRRRRTLRWHVHQFSRRCATVLKRPVRA